MNNNVFIFQLSELASVANKLLIYYSQYKIWLFNGSMGAGKTTLIKSICEILTVTDHVRSPTFSIVNRYESAQNLLVYHFDFYRINHESEALDIGTDEYLDSGNFCFLEWSSKILSLLPKNVLILEIEIIDILTRKLTVLTP